MANIRIEMDRGEGWEVRQEGECACPVESLIAHFPAYAVQYPHRAFVDGVLVAEAQPQKRRARR